MTGRTVRLAIMTGVHFVFEIVLVIGGFIALIGVLLLLADPTDDDAARAAQLRAEAGEPPSQGCPPEDGTPMPQWWFEDAHWPGPS